MSVLKIICCASWDKQLHAATGCLGCARVCHVRLRVFTVLCLSGPKRCQSPTSGDMACLCTLAAPPDCMGLTQSPRAQLSSSLIWPSACPKPQPSQLSGSPPHLPPLHPQGHQPGQSGRQVLQEQQGRCPTAQPTGSGQQGRGAHLATRMPLAAISVSSSPGPK